MIEIIAAILAWNQAIQQFYSYIASLEAVLLLFMTVNYK